VIERTQNAGLLGAHDDEAAERWIPEFDDPLPDAGERGRATSMKMGIIAFARRMTPGAHCLIGGLFLFSSSRCQSVSQLKS